VRRIITLTESDHDRTVSVHCGDVVEVRLPEKPATGFRWAVERIGNKSVALESENFAAPPARAGAGQGGMRIFRFSAGSPGSARVKLKRWREWEGERSTAARFEVTLQVCG
jgi:predicted secreted protein